MAIFIKQTKHIAYLMLFIKMNPEVTDSYEICDLILKVKKKWSQVTTTTKNPKLPLPRSRLGALWARTARRGPGPSRTPSPRWYTRINSGFLGFPLRVPSTVTESWAFRTLLIGKPLGGGGGPGGFVVVRFVVSTRALLVVTTTTSSSSFSSSAFFESSFTLHRMESYLVSKIWGRGATPKKNQR